jgi:LysR family hydrogen peroxide-inducible transcriptional activator
MDLRQLRYFVAIAEAGTMTRAAERCHVAQPSLSQQIAKLERTLGVALFDRLARGVALTPAGKALLPRARGMLADAEEIRVRIAQDVADGAGRFAVGVIPTIAPYTLHRILPRLQEEFPAAEIIIREDLTDHVTEAVEDNELDLAVTSTPIRSELLEVEVVDSEPLMLVLPSGHPLGDAPAVDPADVRDEPTIILNAMHCLGEQMQGFCTRTGMGRSVVCEGTQLGTVLELVAAGMGISLVPRMAARQDDSPRRRYLSFTGAGGWRDIALVRRRDRSESKVAQRFSELLRQLLAESGTR